MKLSKHEFKAPKRQRSKNEKGLPDANARRDLAETYLRTQGRLFPDLVKKGILPRANAKNFARLAEEFERAFLSGMIAEISGKVSMLPMALAAAYLRYSDDNSNPRSLDQQLRNALERAAQDQVFIPWAYVCADAAVTGTIADRRGYKMMKLLIEREDSNVGNFYIDEIGRASRSAIEALTLGKLIESRQKRLIGVSDSFDSANPQSKLMLGIFALLHEWYVDQLREKVNRGMDDAFDRGANIYEAAIGYRLEQALDQRGNPVFDPRDGSPINIKVIDDEGVKWVKKAFELYTLEGWSRQRIAKLFNRNEVDGKRTWDSGRIKQLLTRETYNGRECYRMTRRVVDVASGRMKTVKRPREEWKIREVPHLKIISDDLWDRTQKRLQACAEAYAKNGRRKSRVNLFPKTLLRPICGYCEKPLTLGHSGEYSSFCCSNGLNDKHRCKLKSYKSVKLVEKPILDYIRDQFFTREFLETVICEANEELQSMAEQPKEDVQPILRAIKDEEKKLNRLRKIVVDVDEESVPSLVDDICKREARLGELKAAKADAEVRNEPPPALLTTAEIPAIREDLHGLLNEGIEIAAPLLADLTGPIVVKEHGKASKRGKMWTAHFTINAVPVLAKLVAGRNSPTSSVLEYLTSAGWRKTVDVQLDLKKMPLYAVLGPKSLELHQSGASITAIAAEYHVTRPVVRDGIYFAKTGQKPPRKARKRKRSHHKARSARNRSKGEAIYLEIASIVAGLIDGHELTAEEAQEVLKEKHKTAVSLTTIRRAYYHARCDLAKTACEQGTDLRSLRKRNRRSKGNQRTSPAET